MCGELELSQEHTDAAHLEIHPWPRDKPMIQVYKVTTGFIAVPLSGDLSKRA